VLPYNHTQKQAYSTHVLSWKLKLVKHGCVLHTVTLYSGNYGLCWCCIWLSKPEKSQ